MVKESYIFISGLQASQRDLIRLEMNAGLEVPLVSSNYAILMLNDSL